MVYNIYPAVDNVTYLFPPVVIEKLAATPELRNTIIPMTLTQRNDLSGVNLWDGRLVFNLNTKKINRYDSGTQLWYEIDSDNKVLKAGDTMTGPLTLPGAPTIDLHAATKKYVDDTDLARKNYVDTYRAYPGRNRIINGDFSVNQRGLTSTTTSGVYGHDRWQLTCSGGTTTYSNQTAALGDLPESATQYARMVTSGQSVTSDRALLTNKIEYVKTLSGKTVTVSFWARAASGAPKVAVEATQYFGAGGSPSASVNTYAGKVTLSTTWTRYSVSFAVPSIAGKTLGTAGDFLGVNIWTSAGSDHASSTGSLGIQNATIDLWGVQVEEGAVATPFEFRSPQEELALCQRYYYRRGIYGSPSVYMAGTNSTFGAPVSHPVQMRKTPTMTVFSEYDFTGTQGSWSLWQADMNIVAVVTGHSATADLMWPIASGGSSTRILMTGSFMADAEL